MGSGSSRLAARCSACQTVFRVVPDQLRVSDGWVRCGRCAEVFNAIHNLVDAATGQALPPEQALVDAGQPPGPASTQDAQAAHATQAAQAAPSTDTDAEQPADASAPATENPAAALQSSALADDFEIRIDAAVPPATVGSAGSAALAAPGRLGAPAEADPQTLFAPLPLVPPAADASLPDARAEPGDRPLFVRRADRQARWQQAPVRWALALGAVAALLLLGLQVAHEYRDLVSARWPALQPPLARACALLGCRVEAARDIQSLSVEASGLIRVEKSDLYKLTVTLRNRAGMELALPALDLTLNDNQGRLVARRVLRPADLGAAQSTLAAGAELVLQATLQARLAAAGDAVTGYTIELFYP